MPLWRWWWWLFCGPQIEADQTNHPKRVWMGSFVQYVYIQQSAELDQHKTIPDCKIFENHLRNLLNSNWTALEIQAPIKFHNYYCRLDVKLIFYESVIPKLQGNIHCLHGHNGMCVVNCKIVLFVCSRISPAIFGRACFLLLPHWKHFYSILIANSQKHYCWLLGV
jgi:hypothetical protein